MVVDPMFDKSRLVRAMADRCLAGDFGGSSWLAANQSECLELGISQPNIQYHMDRIDPIKAAARAADRARVLTETAVAAASMPAKPATLSLSSEAGRLPRRLLSPESLASSSQIWDPISGKLRTWPGVRLPLPIRLN